MFKAPSVNNSMLNVLSSNVNLCKFDLMDILYSECDTISMHAFK